MTAQEISELDAASWQRCGIWTGLIGMIVTAVCVSFPILDIWAAEALYTGHRNHFLLTISDVGTMVRNGFQILFAVASVVIVCGLLRSLFASGKAASVARPVWLFLFCALVVGPGVLANAIFKDNWGRARPYQTEQFGGKKQFTVAFELSDQCERNCSFLGGESSSMFALFFALAFSLPRKRRSLIATGIGVGTAVGTLRMAQGGHYFSDIAISAFVMMLVVLALYWVFFLRNRDAGHVLRVRPRVSHQNVWGGLVPARVHAVTPGATRFTQSLRARRSASTYSASDPNGIMTRRSRRLHWLPGVSI